ncbi:MAG: AEC family transporter [Acidobacteriota bacterium]
MEILVDIVLPVFGVAALGYLATRLDWFTAEAEAGLAKFVFDFAVPLMLFRSLATAELPASLPLGYFASYYLSAATVATLGFLLARYVFGRTYGGQVITGFGFGFGNTVLLGLPLILTTFGDDAALPFFILLSVHGLAFFTTTTLLLELDRHAGGTSRRQMVRQIVAALFTNPILLGIFAGLAMQALSLELTGPVEAICALMQQAVTPCALFSLGAALTRYGIAGRLGQSLVLVFGKIVVMPALVYLLASHVFHIEPLWTQVAVVMAAQPTGIMTYIFAKKYDVGQAIATTSVFLSTTLSMVSLSVLLWLFEVR